MRDSSYLKDIRIVTIILLQYLNIQMITLQK